MGGIKFVYCKWFGRFYSACSCFVGAKKSFEAIPLKDVILWNSVVSVYAENGFSLDALEMFTRMQLWGKRPSVCSFLGFLGLSSWTQKLIIWRQIHFCVLKSGFDCGSVHVQSALIDIYGKFGCDHAGLVEEGKMVFDSMKSIHDIEPERQHYSCLVDLHGRAETLSSDNIAVFDELETFDIRVGDGVSNDTQGVELLMARAANGGQHLAKGTGLILAKEHQLEGSYFPH
ncbi:hypothetical protein RHSIM_Rhsim07G0218500 [Rhododendron simsii]|uniref:Pentatricopeptide repeat-containing protein n=1 Tax=Rhododendron simsii TaxID=118357 RepID=A0A834GLQ8_RHOSS|nr:hypothetical protein RHSIM_Rhsim07G0218500 [Rhododendron simsii]